MTGGALFALNGTIGWTPGPAAGIVATVCRCCILALRARKQQKVATSILIIGVATAWSILAGFPETAYISALLVLAWGLTDWSPSLSAGRWPDGRLRVCAGPVVATPLLIAFVDYMRQSGSFGIHNGGEKSLPWAAFSATLMPYVYGSLGTSLHSLPLSQIWFAIGGYTDILIILMALVGLSSRSAHRGLKFILLAWILLAWAKTFGVPPVMGLINHLPLMKQTNFFRYAPPSWELAMIILAAFGLDDFMNRTLVAQTFWCSDRFTGDWHCSRLATARLLGAAKGISSVRVSATGTFCGVGAHRIVRSRSVVETLARAPMPHGAGLSSGVRRRDNVYGAAVGEYTRRLARRVGRAILRQSSGPLACLHPGTNSAQLRCLFPRAVSITTLSRSPSFGQIMLNAIFCRATQQRFRRDVLGR